MKERKTDVLNHNHQLHSWLFITPIHCTASLVFTANLYVIWTHKEENEPEEEQISGKFPALFHFFSDFHQKINFNQFQSHFALFIHK